MFINCVAVVLLTTWVAVMVTQVAVMLHREHKHESFLDDISCQVASWAARHRALALQAKLAFELTAVTLAVWALVR